MRLNFNSIVDHVTLFQNIERIEAYILEPLLSLVNINDIDDGLISNILKFADGTKTEAYGKYRHKEGY